MLELFYNKIMIITRPNVRYLQMFMFCGTKEVGQAYIHIMIMRKTLQKQKAPKNNAALYLMLTKFIKCENK